MRPGATDHRLDGVSEKVLLTAGGLAIAGLLANLGGPHQPAPREALLLLLIAGPLLEALSSQPSQCRAGSGWPALALATGFPGVGVGWLLSAHLLVRGVGEAALRGLPARDMLLLLGRSLPVVAVVAAAPYLPNRTSQLGLVPLFLGLTLALDDRQPKGRVWRRAFEELLWFGALVWASSHGPWALLAGLVALIAVFSRPGDTADEDMQRSLSLQMSSTETTLRASQRRFQEDKSRFHDILSLQQILDDFQNSALRAESSQGLAAPLVEAMVRVDERCQAGVCLAQPDEGLILLSGSNRFALAHFHPLPSGWRAGQMLRSPCGKRCFYALGGGLFFLMESALTEAGKKESQDQLIEQLLVRARLILRILEQKRELADLLSQKSEALDQLATSQAQLLQSEKLAAIGQLAAGVAHEINSPLAAIHLQAQMARRRLRKDDVEGVLRSLETCEQASLRAKAIIESLLAYSQFSDGVRDTVSLADLVDQALRMLEAHFEQSEITVKLALGQLPALHVNSQEIGQILTNVLLNAVDALQERPNERRVLISAVREGGEQRLTISNNGPPLSEEVAERLFDPFFTTKEVGSGTGLGLSIAYQLARGHGGYIQAANNKGWVHFTLGLPEATGPG